MAPYASNTEMDNIIGEERLKAFFTKSVSALELEDFKTAKANAASGLMDTYFRRGGYTVPLDTTAITDTDAKARLDALLAEVCCAMVLQSLTAGQRGIGKGQDEARTWARRWLEDIAAGRQTLIGFDQSARQLAVVGTDDPLIPKTLFSNLRYPA